MQEKLLAKSHYWNRSNSRLYQENFRQSKNGNWGFEHYKARLDRVPDDFDEERYKRNVFAGKPGPFKQPNHMQTLPNLGEPQHFSFD